MVEFCKFREMPATPVENKTSLEADVKELKQTVASIVDSISKMGPLANVTAPFAMHSTPIASSKLMDGTNDTYNTNENECSVLLPNTLEPETFALFLTNIDKRATEYDVSQMVLRSLGAAESDYIDVVKLVPRWKDFNSLDFVSFKIVLNENWKAKAMTASTWPKGIKFRKFINKQNETWRPTTMSG